MSNLLTLEEQEQAILLLEACIPYLQSAHDEAEYNHGDCGSDFYMDESQYDIMSKTTALISNIETLLKKA